MTIKPATSLLFVPLFFLVATPAQAKNSIPLRGFSREDRQEFKIKFNQTKVETLYQKIRSGFVNRFNYQNQVKTRLEKRIEEKSTAGKDVSAVKTKLATYIATVDAYTKSLETFDKKYQEIIVLEKPITKFGELKAAGKEILKNLQDGRKILIESARLLFNLK